MEELILLAGLGTVALAEALWWHLRGKHQAPDGLPWLRVQARTRRTRRAARRGPRFAKLGRVRPAR